MMRVLVTRPMADAAELAAQLSALGHVVTIEPMLRIVSLPVDANDFTGAQAVIATSRNGLRALAASEAIEIARTLPIFSVGPGTTELAREVGFRNVIEGAGSGRDLVAPITRHCDAAEGPLVHVAGEKLAFDLAAALTEHGITVRTVTAYRAEPTATLSAETTGAIATGGLDAVILMSPRTAEIFARLVDAAGVAEAARRLTCICLSQAVAARLAGLVPVRSEIAEQPNSAALLATLGRVATHSTGV
jgi:uroporphyrinogen-III synthase